MPVADLYAQILFWELYLGVEKPKGYAPEKGAGGAVGVGYCPEGEAKGWQSDVTWVVSQ